MSLLAPLYFFGALAIGLPILFHLIRRQPKGQVEFSSLMFLQSTPPRLTRRSRLDNWPLLLLRALALILLATAFARPFLRSVAHSEAELPGRRLVLVIDTSASMQRAGLWQQALDKANDVLSDLQPADRLAIVSFDRKPKTLLGFEQSGQMGTAQLKMTAEKLLRETAPTWHRTEMGRAISFAADLAVSYEPEEETQVGVDEPTIPTFASSTGSAHMILISDMQAGSRIEGLQVYAWPDKLRLDVRRVSPREKTNASAQILARTPDDDVDRVRVRVSNSPNSTESRFSIKWSLASVDSASEQTPAASTTEPAMEMPVQVPPGEARVVRMPLPPAGVTELVLQGDNHSFDNTRYVLSPQPESVSLWYVGKVDADARDSLFYYLQRVPLSNVRRVVSVEAIAQDKLVEVPDAKKVPLVVVASSVSADAAVRLREYVTSGGRLLVVFATEDGSQSLAASVNAISGASLSVTEASVNDYAMLSRINFRHPVFESMADPQFNDFSKIRFWSHRKISNLDDSWQTVAHFDDGDPALIDQQIGEGRVLVLTAGWQPTASQLALSTKFIPLVFRWFQSDRRPTAADRYTVGEAIDLRPADGATITGPAGTAFKYQSLEDLDGIDQPGIYRFADSDSTLSFAVNLAESESQTEAIDEDELERFGVLLGKNVTTEQAKVNQRQLRDRELESSQKIWQWLLVTALALLGLEIWLAARWSRPTADEGAELRGV